MGFGIVQPFGCVQRPLLKRKIETIFSRTDSFPTYNFLISILNKEHCRKIDSKYYTPSSESCSLAFGRKTGARNRTIAKRLSAHFNENKKGRHDRIHDGARFRTADPDTALYRSAFLISDLRLFYCVSVIVQVLITLAFCIVCFF